MWKSLLSRYELYIYVIVLLFNAFLILRERDSLSFYLDNPAHLAELHELAFNPSGWSEIGFLGFPLESLHSPLWYGLCAWFVRYGMNDELVYQVATYIGFVVPALAIFWVSRRYTKSWLGFLIALQVLLLHHSVSGLGSANGGMWTYYIACSLVVILLEKLRHPYGYSFEYYLFAEVVLSKNIVWKEVPITMRYPPKGTRYSKIRPVVGWYQMLRPWGIARMSPKGFK